MVKDQVLVTIRAEIIDSGRDDRYSLAAYAFVLNGLEFHLARIGEKRHVTGQEFARGLIEFAKKQFGPIAEDVLLRWGIHATDDFGYIVYNLIDIGLMSRRESDRVEDFFNVCNLAKEFATIDDELLDKKHIRAIKGA